MNNKRFTRKISVFHGRKAPEEGILVGYGAVIEAYQLKLPIPPILSLISSKRRQYKTESWNVFTSRHLPEDKLYKQLIFAMRYEGINLLFFKRLFEVLSRQEIKKLIQLEPLGQYSRKMWFLYEWLFNKQLDIPNLKRGNYIDLLDEKLQYGIEGIRSQRHRIVNNLPGTPAFCPLISRTEKLDNFLSRNIIKKNVEYLDVIHKDVLQRASAFLLMKDSKSSFTIEGEKPTNNRAARWGKAIGQAGKNDLTREELIRLQQIILKSSRFTSLGFRKADGFVGEHDRINGEPIPAHISAKWQDIDSLLYGLIATTEKLNNSSLDAVLIASLIAFGFVFIHPFSDGNGRIHRYLIHHILAKTGFATQGIIFPVSTAILNNIDKYRLVLESYSLPLLDFIAWQTTPDNNVEVLNETIDYYRYYDATGQAEFLHECVQETIEKIIPEEVNYIRNYDEMKSFMDDRFDMPDKMLAMLIRFLQQNDGHLSKRAKSKEFMQLTSEEVIDIESIYREIFLDADL